MGCSEMDQSHTPVSWVFLGLWDSDAMRPFRVIRAARDHRGEGREGDPGGCEEDRGAMVVGRGGGGGRIARRATG